MENVTALANQLFTMMLYLAVGFLLNKTSLITEKTGSALSNLLLYVILPCVIVKAFFVEYSAGQTQALLWALLLGALAILLAMLLSFLVFRKHPIENFGSAFSNAGFMGIPLITAVLGNGAVFYTAGMVAMLNILQWTYGQSLLAGNWKECRPKAILKNPLVISFALGLIVYFCRISLPAILMNTVSAFAACNGPVAMVIIGVFLARIRPESLRSGSVWIGCALRLLVIPAATILLFCLFPGVDETIRTAILIAAMAPVGSNLAIYVQKTGGSVGEATSFVCLSTLLSLGTMPLMLYLASVVSFI